MSDRTLEPSSPLRYRRECIHEVSLFFRHVLPLYDQSHLQALHLVSHHATLMALDLVVKPAASARPILFISTVFLATHAWLLEGERV